MVAKRNLKQDDKKKSDLLLNIKEEVLPIVFKDPYLTPYINYFNDIRDQVSATTRRLTENKCTLWEFATAHKYFGLHLEINENNEEEWVLRECAPNATDIYLIGDFSDWKPSKEYAFTSTGLGNWEIRLPKDALHHNDLFRLYMKWHGGEGERIPSYAQRVIQDNHTKMFSAQVWQPAKKYEWKIENFVPNNDEPLLIYECHIGMAQEAERVGTYIEFENNILPRIKDAGYNTIQIMAIMEHPYYGSFGYQVSNFFAPSSRFGTPDELKSLIDKAHSMGLRVLLDIVHSHAVKNEVEGISKFDGTYSLFFHDGDRGEHPLWDSRLFNYAKTEVLRFLLSNVRYWLEDYKFDGFRFDGVTSMLYKNHGVGTAFMGYQDYFCDNLDKDALTYLTLANKLIHEGNKNAITIAEDVSGFPGLANSIENGGNGFDYRLAMGIPDFWIKTLKEKKDEDWHVEGILWELTNRRNDEKTISYAESHDQALVGDQTIIFRLLQILIYDSMRLDQQNFLIDRGLAIHRLIKLITISTAGDGYLNFMGNEFGHPEWIDFPREGNNWSYHHARRQWSLRDNSDLQFYRIAAFDKAMLDLMKHYNIMKGYNYVEKVYSHIDDEVLCYKRKGLYFLFNFNPAKSFADYRINGVEPGKYKLVFNTEDYDFGGLGRIAHDQEFLTSNEAMKDDKGNEYIETYFKVYLPTRSAMVLEKLKE